MHYSHDAFGIEYSKKNFMRTIRPKSGVNIGQSERLSDSDICNINSLYYFADGANTRRVSFKAANGKYVRAGVRIDQSNLSFLTASSPHIKAWETFNLIELCRDPDDYTKRIFAIQSAHSKNFVRAGLGNRSFIAATSPHIKAWETFRLIDLGIGKVAIQSAHSDRIVRAAVQLGSNKSLLAASSPHIDLWETFELVELAN